MNKKSKTEALEKLRARKGILVLLALFMLYNYNFIHSAEYLPAVRKSPQTTRSEIPGTLTTGPEYDLIQALPFVKVNCAADGNYPILMQKNGMINWVCDNKGERKVTQIMLFVFNKYASESANTLMLDVGANTGYYGLLAAKFGHKVIQFDLQPECLKILRNSVLANGFADRVITVAAGVSDSYATISVPEKGCDGRFPASAHEAGQLSSSATATLRPLNDFLKLQENETIILMKIDTEGNEQRVLAGSRNYFKTQKVVNAIVEVTPGVKFWENNGITKEEVVETLKEVVNFGYWIISLWDYSVHRTAESIAKYMESPAFKQTDFVITIDQDFRELIGDKDTLDPDQIKI